MQGNILPLAIVPYFAARSENLRLFIACYQVYFQPVFRTGCPVVKRAGCSERLVTDCLIKHNVYLPFSGSLVSKPEHFIEFFRIIKVEFETHTFYEFFERYG